MTEKLSQISQIFLEHEKKWFTVLSTKVLFLDVFLVHMHSTTVVNNEFIFRKFSLSTSFKDSAIDLACMHAGEFKIV